KPWQPRQAQFQEPATISEKAQPAPAVDTVTNGAVANTPTATARPEPRPPAPTRAAVIDRDVSGFVSSGSASLPSGAPVQRQASEQPKALGLAGGVITGARPIMPPPAPQPPALVKTSQGEESASSYAADAASKDAKQDYVNRRVLRADSETVEVTAESPV